MTNKWTTCTYVVCFIKNVLHVRRIFIEDEIATLYVSKFVIVGLKFVLLKYILNDEC